jgi:phosphate-selective porin OprO/OprP
VPAWIIGALVCGGFALCGSRATAQQADDGATPDDVRAALAQHEQEIHQLHEQIAAAQQGTAVNPTAFASTDLSAASATVADANTAQNPGGGYVVGSDTTMTATFKNGLFLWLETPNKDFTMHPGIFVHYDTVWVGSSNAAVTNPKGAYAGPTQGVAVGNALGGMGTVQDGTEFRRIRPFLEGTYWETGEYRLTLALANDQYGTVGLDEFWVGTKDIPFINTVRVGHVKEGLGLEGDMVPSSRCMTFMERSAYSQSIELNQNFLTGVVFINDYFDQRMTSMFCVGRPDQAAQFGSYFGDGQGAAEFRLSGLPLYEDEGRHLLHVACSTGWRDGQSSGNNVNMVQLRTRPEILDDDPAGGAGGAADVPNGNGNRFLDTGYMVSNTEYILGTELLYVRGPLSFQAEYGWSFVDGVTGVASSLGGSVVSLPVGGVHDYTFSGGYLQVAYTLTGENRAYDKRLGTLARSYYGAQGPYEKAFITRGPDGTCCWGLGAWELALRYSYLDLNSGTGLGRIQGGEMEGLTLGLNWVMNQNFELMFDYVNDFRYETPVTTTGLATTANTTVTGAVQGFGIRAQLQF